MRDNERADLVMIGVEEKRGWRGWNKREPITMKRGVGHGMYTVV
jgi:hypothetical protein